MDRTVNPYNWGIQRWRFEKLDVNDVDNLCKIIKAKINLQEGNITEQQYNEILG